ncbi:MAG: class E sortase [Dactylosporangium sp.]|nr:class E sortase [Dactylosporangium sp.]NNJ61571.1 class E sortase [Dactylosporangium sp.]
MTRRTVWTVLRTATRTSGELMIAFGMIVLLFAAYEVWGVGAQVSAHQNDLSNQLDQAWSPPPSAVAPSASPVPTEPPTAGSPIAKLYIPKIKPESSWVVVEGTGLDDIRYAPGHYPETAMPGDIGNFSVAGHRTLKIFWNLDKLQAGDQIVVETRDHWFVYETTDSQVVSPTARSVIAPVPNKPGETPTQAMVTLTTCNPKGQNYQRLIVHGVLTEQLSHEMGPPTGVTG